MYYGKKLAMKMLMCDKMGSGVLCLENTKYYKHLKMAGYITLCMVVPPVDVLTCSVNFSCIMVPLESSN
jgi:hypothetical protein